MLSNPRSLPTFRGLETALTNQDFRLADEITRDLICHLAGKPLPVTPEIFEQVGYEHLSRIDRLWWENSEERFGFRAQAAIWVDVGGPARILRHENMADYQFWSLAEYEFEFGYRVGWAEKPRPMREKTGWGWLGCTFEESSMKKGALPYEYLMCSYSYGSIGLVAAAVAARFRSG